MREIEVPGISQEEFIEEFGENALRDVPSQYVISWNKEVYILEGWNQPN